MEDTKHDKTIDVKPKNWRLKLFRNGGILFIALLLCVVQYGRERAATERRAGRCGGGPLERELSLRAEDAFYYHFYKTVVEERPLLAAVTSLTRDRLVAPPGEVNAFHRYNIYPEVALGALYRWLEPWLWAGEAGAALRLYERALSALAGLRLAALFLYGTTLSGSVCGGLVSAASGAAGGAAGGGREQLSMLLLLLHAWLLAVRLRSAHTHSLLLQVSLVAAGCACLLCGGGARWWLLCGAGALWLLQQLRVLRGAALAALLHAHFSALHLALLLHRGAALQTSLYTACLLVLCAYCLFFSSFRIKVVTTCDLLVESWLVLLRLCLVVCVSLCLKHALSALLGVEERSPPWRALGALLAGGGAPAACTSGAGCWGAAPLALLGAARHCRAWAARAAADSASHDGCAARARALATHADPAVLLLLLQVPAGGALCALCARPAPLAAQLSALAALAVPARRTRVRVCVSALCAALLLGAVRADPGAAGECGALVSLCAWARGSGRGSFAAPPRAAAALLLAARRPLAQHTLGEECGACGGQRAAGARPAFLVLECGLGQADCAPAAAERLQLVFRNEQYAVFRHHELSVRYMPRVFDS